MRRLILACGILLLAYPLSPATAQARATQSPIPIPEECTFSQPARIVASMKDLPEVAAEFERHRLVIADAGEAFIPGDVIDSNLPRRQFQRAYVFENRIIVWYFHGGFAAHIHAVEFRRMRDSGQADLVLRLTPLQLIGPPCEATQALLDGVWSAHDR